MVRTRALRKVVFGCVQCLLEGRLDLRGACQQGIQACQYLYLRMGFCKDGLNIQGSLMGPAGLIPYFQLYFECTKLDFTCSTTVVMCMTARRCCAQVFVPDPLAAN
jgi:hypothetical protein